MTKIPAMLSMFFGVFLFAEICESSSDSSSLLINLADQDSQFFGRFQRSVVNITHNISAGTNITRSFEICVDTRSQFLFKMNTSVIGCGALSSNSTSFPPNATENSTNTEKNCSSTSCHNLSGLVEAYKTESYGIFALPILVRANFTVLVSNKSKLARNCSFNPGDGKSSSKILAGEEVLSFTHHYVSYGSFRARVRCVGNSSLLLDVSRRVYVNIPSVIKSLSCPTNVATNRTLPCLLNVLQAMKLNVSVSVDDREEASHNLSETPVKIVGSTNETVEDMNCPSSDAGGDGTKLVIIPSISFDEKFYLRAMQLVSSISGSLQLQIFRALDKQTSASQDFSGKFSCPSPATQTDNITVCFKTLAMEYKSSSYTKSSTRMTAVHNVPFFVNVGYNYVTLTDHDAFVIDPEDLIVLTIDQSSGFVDSSSAANNTDTSYISTAVNPGEISSTINPSDVPTTIDPGVISTTVDPGAIPTTIDPGVISTTIDPGAIPTTIDPGVISTTIDPGVISTTIDPGAISTTIDPGVISTTIDPGVISTTIDLGAIPTTVDPGAISTTMNSSDASITIDPGAISTTIDLGAISTTIDPGAISTTMDPGVISTTIDPGAMSTTIETGVISTTIDPGVISTTMNPSDASITIDPSVISTTIDPGVISTTMNQTNVSATTYPGHSLTTITLAMVSTTRKPNDISITINPNEISTTINQHSISTAVNQSGISNRTNSSSRCSGKLLFHELNFYGFLPYETRILLRFMNPSDSSLGINIRDQTESVKIFKQVIIVQESVGKIHVRYKDIVRVNSTQTLGFQLERGTNASCMWSLGGPNVDLAGFVYGTASCIGNETETGGAERQTGDLESNFNYTYITHGTFQYLVTCWNKVSNISEVVSISVRRNISEFNASLCFASFAYEYAETCWKASAFGDHVKYKWIIGSDVFEKSEFETVFKSHTPPDEWKIANASATNVISEKHLVVWFKVLENPLSIELYSPLVVPSLSVVSFTGIVSWKSYPNGTAFYEAHGVEISEGLRRFVDSPTFRVHTHGKYIATNISNATVLNYTFPLAGSESDEYVLLFEASGHPEMNRKVKIRIVDEIRELKVTSSCSSQVVVNNSCSFKASYSRGSDVSCRWQVGSRNYGSGCGIEYKFQELRNVTINLDAENTVSSAKAILNVTVVEPQMSNFSRTSTYYVIRPSMTSYSIDPSRSAVAPTSSEVGPFGSLRIHGPRYVEVGKEVNFTTSVVSLDVVFHWFVNNILRSSNSSSVSVVFERPDVFQVSVNVSNQTHHQNASISIFVRHPISGLETTLSQNGSGKTVVALFSVRSGTNVSFSADFGDGSPVHTGDVRELMRNVSVSHIYEKPGWYNISITVFNMVGTNLTNYGAVFVKKTCEMVSVDLHGTSTDPHILNSFTETDTIEFSVTTKMNCSSVVEPQFSWKIFSMNSTISEKDTIKFENTVTNGSTIKFSAGQINFGTYKVIVTVVVPSDGASFNRSGYFSKVAKKPIVRILCGNARTIPVDRPLVLNATVTGGVDLSKNLSYEWFCDDKFNVNCFRGNITRDRSVVRFPGSFLPSGKTFDFVARVTDGRGVGTVSHKIIVGHSNTTLQVCLSSSQDSTKTILHSQKTEITVSCIDCNNTSNLTWSWSLTNVTKDIPQPTLDVNHLSGNEGKIIIPANTLQPGDWYRIRANVTGSGNRGGYGSYDLFTNDVPSRGYCHVTPSEGFALKTAFSCTCQAWYDRDQPLSYECWYSIDGDTYNLFYNGRHSESSPTFLEAGLKDRNYTVGIKVVVKDSLGASTVKIFTVKNHPMSQDQFNEIFNSSSNINQQVDSILNNSDPQASAQYIKTVSNVLNGKSTNDTQEEDKRIQIREALLRHATSLCCSDGSSIEQSLQTMLAVTQVPTELNLQAQFYASSTFVKISKNLSSSSSELTNQSYANSLVQGVSSVLEASLLRTNQNNSDEIRQINEACLQATDIVGDVLLLELKPEEPAITLVTPLQSIAVQKHLISSFVGTRLMASGHSDEFLVPQSIGNIGGASVGTKLVSMQNNPFSWASSSSAVPTTGVSSLELKDAEGQKVVVKDLSEPFSMFLYSSDQSGAVASNSAKLSERSVPDFYEVNTTSSSSAILVTLHRVIADTKGQLRLRLQNHDRSAVLSNDVIVSTESLFPVSLTWNNLDGHERYGVSVEYETFSIGVRKVPYQVEYTISFKEIGCFYWNESKEVWDSNGCKVGSLSTHLRTHCLCDHLTWFGGSLVVPPNSISLSTIAERIDDPSNYATILGVLCSICVLYFLAVLWARRKDKQDASKDLITWCPSNHVTDSHVYQVTVYTGIRRNAGTTANVGLMLLGDSGKSRKCLLKDSRKEVLERGGVNPFLITTMESLGNLEYVHIWHNNSGPDPAWFVNRVVVMDTHTCQVWNFLCYRWLAVDEGDGRIQRLLPVAEAEELVMFRHLFVSRATVELTDAHLWFSVVFRPACSSFTRVQRVSCCLSLLLTSMMANAMWYKTGGSGGDQIDLGLFKFSWEEVFIGISSSLIVFPVNFLLVQLFRRCPLKQPESTNKLSSILNSVFNQEQLSKFSLLRPMPSPPASHDMTLPTNVATPTQGPEGVTSDASHTTSFTIGMTSSDSFVTSSTRQVNSQCGQAGQLKAYVLPNWFTYVAWFVLLVTCLTSATVTFMYCIQFGEDKSRKWLLSLTISVVNDIFVAQPFKVFAVTILFAYIIKRPLKERHYIEGAINKRLETVSRDDVEVEAPDPSLCSAEDFLATAREQREKDKFMYGLLRTLCSHMVFIVLVLIIAYSQRISSAYHLTNHQKNTFTRPGFLKRLGKRRPPGFDKVANARDFWLWNQAVFIPGLSNLEWYNYTREWSSFTANFGGFVVGGARWRQKRLRKGACHVLPIFRETIPKCTGKYEWGNEDTSNYFASWRMPLVNASCPEESNPSDFWCSSSSDALKTFPYVGDLETYSGGGYAIDILPNYEKSLNLTGNLKRRGWIDEYTRAVFVEFTLYNPNVDLFSVNTLLFEVWATGGFVTRAEILSIRLYNYVGNFQIFVLICQLLFLGFVCYFTYRSGKLLVREKWNYFKKTWNVHELLVVANSWLLVAFYFVSIAVRTWTMENFRENSTKFTSFWYSSTWQMSLEYVMAWLVFLVSLKFLHLFQFNRRMFLLPLTLSNTAGDLLSYSFVFIMVYMAFTFLYYFVLHSYELYCANVIVTVETLMRVLLGKSNAVLQHTSFPFFERLILFCYICLMKFILLNIFVVILNDGFFRAREQVDELRNDFEFFDFVKDTLFDLLGIRRPHAKPCLVHFDKQETVIEQELHDLEKKVDRMCKLVDFIAFDEDL